MLRRIFVFNRKFIVYNYSTRVEIDNSLKNDFEIKKFKPRKHPGTTRFKIASIPPDIQKAIDIVLHDTNAKSYQEESMKLDNYLRSRHLPPEDRDIDLKTKAIHDKVSKQVLANVSQNLTDDERNKYDNLIKVKVFNTLKQTVYSWANISYDAATCLQYLIARAAPEYATLVRILDEIRIKFPDYVPRSFFDFGSGVGTGTWAINNFWKKDIFEYFCVDTSPDMHDLARLILCGGKENKELPHRAYFQRQFLPASSDTKYDIVLSAFSFFELPDMKSRIQTLQNLWNKTETFLIIVEQGSLAGFQVINEAREFILNSKRNPGYVVSPCPNDNVCPRYLEQNTPCNFLMKYESLKNSNKSEVSADIFSYVVLKKGKRPEDDPQWPRIVRAPLVRSGHTICRLCTAQGELKEIIFTKSKHDQITYRCARSSNWGDLLPVKL